MSNVGSQTNLSVKLSGGKIKSKRGTLKKKTSQFFANYKTSFVAVDQGEICFASSAIDDDDDAKKESHSLLNVKDVKLLGPDSAEFCVKIAGGVRGSSSTSVILCAESPAEAREWIQTLRHEMLNQVLVMRNMIELMDEKAKNPERSEGLRLQAISVLCVAHGSPSAEAVHEARMEYAKWLDAQDREDDAREVRRTANELRERERGDSIGRSPSRRRRWSKKFSPRAASIERDGSTDPTARVSSPRFSWRKHGSNSSLPPAAPQTTRSSRNLGKESIDAEGGENDLL